MRSLAKILPVAIDDLLPSSPSPKSSSNDDHHENNIEEYVESIQRTKNLLKTKAEMAEEERVRQRKKKEKEMAEIISTKNQNVQESFSISAFWREYYKYYEVVIKGDKGQRNDQIEREIGLLREIEFFNAAVRRIA
jgi:hypothetical protein